MIRRSVVFVLLLAIACLGNAAYGWGSFGHEVIAQIGYANCTPTTQQAIQSIISADPLHRDLFSMATWPDDIREHKAPPPSDSQINAAWHFADIPYTPGQTYGKAQQDQFLAQPNTVTWAIQHEAAILRSPNSSPVDRANALAWVIHLVGDAHQPLHCTTRITDQWPVPDGDRGGNDFYLSSRTGRGAPELHTLWDDAPESLSPHSLKRLTDEQRDQLATQVADSLMQTSPRNTTANVDDSNPSDWAEEGYDLADKVYNTPEGQQPSDAYRQWALTETRLRLAQAGYRLADLLNACLGS